MCVCAYTSLIYIYTHIWEIYIHMGDIHNIYTYTHTVYRAFSPRIWTIHLDLESWRRGRNFQQRRPQCRCLWGGVLCKDLPADLEFKLVSSESPYLSIWTSDSGCPIIFTAFCAVMNQPCEHFLPVRGKKAFQSHPKMAKQNRKLLSNLHCYCMLLQQVPREVPS